MTENCSECGQPFVPSPAQIAATPLPVNASPPPAPGAAAAAAVCHEEQLEIWADEFLEHLLAADCAPEFDGYGEKIVYFSAVKDAIKDLVGKAFDHPELAAFPLPEEIERLAERLNRCLSLSGADINYVAAQCAQASAALQQQARDLQWYAKEREDLRDRLDHRELYGVKTKAELEDALARIRELEAELHEINSACDAQIRRAERAEAERIEHLGWLKEMTAERDAAKDNHAAVIEAHKITMADLLKCESERDAIKAKTFEECAQLCELRADYNINPEGKAAFLELAEAIRALNQPPEAGEGGE